VIGGAVEVEVVRGGLSRERADGILELWNQHGALEGEAARRRLADVVAVAVDKATGEVVGVNSVYAERVPLVGNYLFWLYRRFIPDAGDDVGDAMLDAARAALEADYDPDGDGPIGLCILVDDPDVVERRREAVWPRTELAYAGYLPDGRQVRVRYFDGARIV
jgi:hypothetical protein